MTVDSVVPAVKSPDAELASRLRAAVDFLPHIVAYLLPDERYALVNEAYVTWFGVRPEEVVGKTIFEFLGPAAYERIIPHIRRAFAGEMVTFEQYDIPYRLGALRDVHFNFFPHVGADGSVLGVVAVHEDITVRRRLEREASIEQDRTAFLLRLATSLGEKLDLEVVMQRLVDSIAPARAAVATVWDLGGGAPRFRAVSGGGTLDESYESWSASAVTVPIRRGSETVAVLGLRLAQDAPLDGALFESAARLASVAYENARLFEETMRLRRAAEDAAAAKDAFLARVSHDLRNPLNSILGWAGLIRQMQGDPAQLARGIDVIERNAKAQVKLIEDLLDVSRLGAGKLKLSFVVEDVKVAIDTALDPARLAADAKRVRLEVILHPDIGAMAVDPDRFRQIVWNLVANAVKFTPSGGRVRVAAQRIGSRLRIDVADTGRGIPTDFLPKVFSAFEQVDGGRRRAEGLGLGLAITKDLVELHGGTITVSSEGEGRGATFTVTLPIRAAVPPAAPLPLAPRALEGVRLVVVDDEEEAREIVSTILSQAGARLTTAASADEAIAAVLRERPDALVSDIGMPGKTGIDLVRELRGLSADQGGKTPALALTALVREHERQRILRAGFDAHAAKPIEPSYLVSIVAGLLTPAGD
jgi:PAS domain S-box-containing protein